MRVLSAASWYDRIQEFESKCAYCGKLVERHLLTKDHVLPKSRGGSNSSKNIVPACDKCNNEKADRTLEEWKSFLRGNGRWQDFNGILMQPTFIQDGKPTTTKSCIVYKQGKKHKLNFCRVTPDKVDAKVKALKEGDPYFELVSIEAPRFLP